MNRQSFVDFLHQHQGPLFAFEVDADRWELARARRHALGSYLAVRVTDSEGEPAVFVVLSTVEPKSVRAARLNGVKAASKAELWLRLRRTEEVEFSSDWGRLLLGKPAAATVA